MNRPLWEQASESPSLQNGIKWIFDPENSILESEHNENFCGKVNSKSKQPYLET